MESYLSTLPEFQDSQQTRSLFSAFYKKRSDSHESFHIKYVFWRDLIVSVVSKGLVGDDMLSFDSRVLKQKLHYRGVFPLDLLYVIATMEEEGVLAREQTLRQKFTGHSYLSSLWSLSTGSLTWMKNIINTYLLEGVEDPQGPFVHGHFVLTQKLESLAADFLSAFMARDFIDNSLTRSEFVAPLKQLCERLSLGVPSENDANLLKWFLGSKKSCTASKNSIYMGVLSKDQRECFGSVIHMKENISSLESHILKTETLIQNIQKELKGSLLENRPREVSILLLKKRKDYESLLLGLLQSRENISQIVMSIRKAKTDSAILEAYKIGTEALRAVVPDAVSIDATMDDLIGVLDKFKETEDAIEQGNRLISGDQSHLEDELNAMLEEDKLASDEKLLQELENLRIPSYLPSTRIPELQSDE